MTAIYQTAAAQQTRTKNDGATPVQIMDDTGTPVSSSNPLSVEVTGVDITVTDATFDTTGLALETGGNLAALVAGSDLSTATVAIAASHSSDTVVKASAGRLARVLVTVTGTNAMVIYDNATTHSGVVIGVIPANPVAGDIHVFHMPAANGVTVQGNAANPGVTISYA